MPDSGFLCCAAWLWRCRVLSFARNLIAEWIADETARRGILVDNPAQWFLFQELA
jgi:hypothetical protein